MENEFISIEFATSTIAELIGYSYNMLKKPDLDNTSRFLWKNLYDQLYIEKRHLYHHQGNMNEVKRIIEKVEKQYSPFIKNEIR